MGQIRIYTIAESAYAEQYYSLVDRAFEEDGYPIAINEINEDERIFEVSVYTDQSNMLAVAERFAAVLQLNPEFIQTEQLPNIDWVKHSLEGLRPVRAGRFFVHGHHDRDLKIANDLGIEVEAAQAFGTGHHGTTAGCLEMITHVLPREKPAVALDLGTGSGVLAIAMAKLRPCKVIASDIDAIATQIARQNVRLNGVSRRVQVVTAAGFHHRDIKNNAPYNLIVANILAKPLMVLAPAMVRSLAKNGSLILSGILDSQREKVLAAFRTQGLYQRQTLHRDGWVTLHLK